VALFTSVQSGNWHDLTTWDQGAVPDLSVDDVTVANGHEVVLESSYDESVTSGRLLTVGTGGTLRVQGSLDANGGDMIVAGDLIVEGGSSLLTLSGGHLEIDPTGTGTIDSGFFLESGGTTNVEGLLEITSSGYMELYGAGAVLTVATGGVMDFYCEGYVEDGSEFHLHGDFQINTGGEIAVGDAVMTIEQDGVAVIDSTLSTTYYGLIDVFGYLGVAADGYLRVYPNAQVNVYKDISIGGRMTGGGQVLMLRREGRILDFNDNPIFVLDRAYGFGQTQIA
jgi:hypothetical protein